MAIDEIETPSAPKPSVSPKESGVVMSPSANSCSQNGSSQPKITPKEATPAKKPTPPPTQKDFIISVAHKLSIQPLQNSEPGVWGVLTAISPKARKRSQGMNILLTGDEHCIGRLEEDMKFRIESNAVSGRHCRIYKARIGSEDVEEGSTSCNAVFLKDTSTNGTYLNWEKLKKNVSGAILKHGDIVSFAAMPDHELAFAFVYREVLNSTVSMDGAALKRKAGEFVSESKRLKGIGIGAPDGPISLDDVRSLQRSNKELRKQLESHVLTIETVRKEQREAVACHENELKELKESVSQTYLNENKDLQSTLEAKQKELVQIAAVSAERQQSMVDLNERLSASMQSRTDADEIINRQKATLSELERQLNEERNQRREEREKALADQRAALHRAHLEAQEELKRQSDNASRQERELKEVINKLQGSDKESRLLLETVRSKLEDTRESLVISEKKVRQLEAQVQEEQQVSINGRKKVEALEIEMKRLGKELESEKVAREEAWVKVSALELEIAASLRDLAVEKQRFQGAKERIILRESQLRSFYSTTEEITSLFTKQQEQLKAMQRTLEDEENYDNVSFDVDANAARENRNESMFRAKQAATPGNNNVRESSAASSPRVDRIQVESTSDEGSATEKHECDLRNEEDHHTQDLECTSVDRSVKGAFGSDIEGVGTAPELEGDPIETEQVLETESPGNDTNLGGMHIGLSRSNTVTGDKMLLDDDVQIQEDGGIPRVYEKSAHCLESNNPEKDTNLGGRLIDLNKSNTFTEDTMLLDDDVQVQENEGLNAHCSPSNSPHDSLKAMEDTEGTGTIRTSDLLTSEVAGSWAISTAPSVYGENDSPRSEDKDGAGNHDEAAGSPLSEGQAAGSQVASGTTKLSQERQALNEMIEIVAPGFNEQYSRGASSRGRDEDEASVSDSDTQGGSDNDDDAVDKSVSETQEESEQGDEEKDDEMDYSNDERREDSLG